MHRRPVRRKARSQGAPFVIATLGVALVACQDAVDPPVATSIEAVSAISQTAVAGTAAGAAPAVRILDQRGEPMPGVRVTFDLVEGDGHLSDASAATGADGIAGVRTWRLGVLAGHNRAAARVGDLQVTFEAEGLAGTASQIHIIAGNSQSGVVAALLAEPVMVRVRDKHGNNVAGVRVVFAPEGGSDAVVSSFSITGTDGVAQASWTAGTRAGLQRLTARADGAGEVQFEASIDAGSPAAADIADGADQAGLVGSMLPRAPAVRVVDSWGNAVAGAAVRFEVVAGGGTLEHDGERADALSVRSGSDGIAQVDSWVLGWTAGSNTVRASGQSWSVDIVSAGHAGPAASLTIHEGDGQSGTAGSAVSTPPAVRVVDAWGNPAAGVDVRFVIQSGAGTLTEPDAVTDADGIAGVAGWTLGNVGTNTVEASIVGLDPVTFTAQAGTGSGGTGGGGADDGDYFLDVDLSGTLTQAQRQEFYAAAGRWASVIAGDLPDVDINVPANACGIPHAAVNRTVDDLLVFVAVVPIDGPGGILGSAGPCYVRSAGGLPVLGAIRLDEADIEFLDTNGRLGDVLAHEFGHVVGVGTRWGSQLVGAGGYDPIFTGPTATAEFLGSGGSTYSGSPVPVENTGGPGTRDGHWRESVLNDELMTGWLNMGANPLSSISVGALADIGYEVDYRFSEGFSIPTGAAAVQGHATPTERMELRETGLPIQPISVDAAGHRAPIQPIRR